MDNEFTRMRRHTCEKIKYYRRIHKFSQGDMADKLWMSKRAYIRLENGETALTLDRLHRISKIFTVPISGLIGMESPVRNEELLREFNSMNQQRMLNEQKILEILNELKSRKS